MRSLFFSFFVRMTIALAFVAAMRVWFTPHGWWLGWVLIVAWAAINALLLAWAVRQTVLRLQKSTAAIAEQRVVRVAEPGYSDFDGLARAIAVASEHVERSLGVAAESRRELEAMIDSMQDAVVAVDQAGRIQWTNQRMQRLIQGTLVSGSASGSVRGSTRVGHALVQMIRDPEVLECVRSALESRTVCEKRATMLMPGGVFQVIASPMPGGGAVAVLHDISRIEEVERTQRDFIANVSHELRTPLTSITGYVETLLDHEAALSLQAREFLTTILKNATRMNRLTEDLLVMARVESRESELELHPAPVAADLLVRDAVAAMSGMVQDADRILEIGETTGCQVFADSDAVVQVLSNLIENGIKYGQPRSGQHARVVVSAHEVAEPFDGVEFSVRDFGQGIASEHIGRIFERFYRVDKARSRESGGTGLGLAIARHVVQQQGGTIRAESELNAGSNFLFTLPKVDSKKPNPSTAIKIQGPFTPL